MKNTTLNTTLICLFCLSFAYNICQFIKIQALETSLMFTRCGTSQYELMKIQEEIKRLEFNPINKDETK